MTRRKQQTEPPPTIREVEGRPHFEAKLPMHIAAGISALRPVLLMLAPTPVDEETTHALVHALGEMIARVDELQAKLRAAEEERDGLREAINRASVALTGGAE